MTFFPFALYEEWLSAVWREFVCAYERGHMDASDTPDRYYNMIAADGPLVYLDNLYLNDGQRREWMDEEVDRLSLATEDAAHLFLAAQASGGVQ